MLKVIILSRKLDKNCYKIASLCMCVNAFVSQFLPSEIIFTTENTLWFCQKEWLEIKKIQTFLNTHTHTHTPFVMWNSVYYFILIWRCFSCGIVIMALCHKFTVNTDNFWWLLKQNTCYLHGFSYPLWL